jgi:hypothetical protein
MLTGCHVIARKISHSVLSGQTRMFGRLDELNAFLIYENLSL